MKKYFLILICISVFSCKTQRTSLIVYKCESIISPSYIILKAPPKIFEMYSPRIYTSTLGEWYTINDTLFLFPKYEYYESNNGMCMDIITSKDSTITSIPQQYIIKKDRIIDVTDYGVILPDIFNNKKVQTEYKQLK